ncbi:MAG: hypothetical protein J1F64_07135 [Oscillospiraceae bacterium]|nr:hypothetical protein [Oscillospiraceae bacterium]
MRKKIAVLMLSSMLLLSSMLSASPVNAKADMSVTDDMPVSFEHSYVMAAEVTVNINGNNIYFPDQSPMIVNDRTMVPMRAIFEAFGARVEWYPEDEAVYAVLGNTDILLVIGYNEMAVGDYFVSLDAAPFIENGRTMVPLRAISEAFNAKVQWDANTRTVLISTDGYTPDIPKPVPSYPQNAMQQSSDSQPDESVQYPEVEVFNEVNRLRAENGLAPLTWSNSLAAVARAHSYDMAAGGYFSHTSLDGRSSSDRIENAGISYRRMAENIAAGQSTAAGAVDSWMNSEGHRANILDPELTHLGVGLAISEGSQYKYYWTQCFTGSAPAANITADNKLSMEHRVLDLVNAERAAYGLNALVWNESLADVARAHSYDMAVRGFFDHTNPDGLSPFDRIKQYGITYSVAAENIAEGQSTPEDVMNAWMNSPGHRANILNASLTELGVGLYISDYGYGYYWTQNFRTPR